MYKCTALEIAGTVFFDDTSSIQNLSVDLVRQQAKDTIGALGQVEQFRPRNGSVFLPLYDINSEDLFVSIVMKIGTGMFAKTILDFLTRQIHARYAPGMPGAEFW